MEMLSFLSKKIFLSFWLLEEGMGINNHLGVKFPIVKHLLKSQKGDFATSQIILPI